MIYIERKMIIHSAICDHLNAHSSVVWAYSFWRFAPTNSCDHLFISKVHQKLLSSMMLVKYGDEHQILSFFFLNCFEWKQIDDRMIQCMSESNILMMIRRCFNSKESNRRWQNMEWINTQINRMKICSEIIIIIRIIAKTKERIKLVMNMHSKRSGIENKWEKIIANEMCKRFNIQSTEP